MSTQTRTPTPFRTRWKDVWAREGLHAALILLFLLNVLFFPCIWGHKSLLKSAGLCASVLPTGSWAGKPVPIRWSQTHDAAAAAWFFEPSLAFTGYEYTKERTIPLWNPYQAYGTPFAANMQSQPFYPLTILLSLHLTPRTYNLYLLTRLFIAGLFAYFFLRLFVSFVPAMAGGIAMMLAGYYILYVDMPHLSVEILMPLALYTAELLLRFPSYARFLAFTVVLFLAMIGGMPESCLLLLAFVYSYIVLRVLSDTNLRRAWIPLALRVALAGVASACLSAFLLLPFLELMRRDYDIHQPRDLAAGFVGLWHEVPDSGVLTYLFPLIYGPYHWLTNEFGVAAFFLALIAIMTAFCIRPAASDPRLRPLTFFCFAFAALLILKRYGIEPVNSVGSWPLFRYVIFPRYEEAVVSVCIAILCAIGLEKLVTREVTKGILAAALGIAFAMVPVAAILGQRRILEEMKAEAVPARIPELAFGVAVCALFGLALCLVGFGHGGLRLGIAVLAVLTLELSLNYIPDLYYIDSELPNQSQNSYLGAPYIDFLKSKCTQSQRIFARDAVLYPNWASVFQLQDVRDLDAMYYWRYLPFLRDFVTPGPSPKREELLNRFTGWDTEYPFTTPLERRLLQLSSVKYILSIQPYTGVPFKLVYDHEIKIYEYDDVLPRAAIYSQVVVANDETDALKKLADPGLDIFRTAVITGKLSSSQAGVIARMNRAAAVPVKAATIAQYRSQGVEIRADLDQPGILVLNDSGYPGWNVTVDGAKANWVSANFLFRGVLLSPGTHVVRFLYRPRTFYTGCLLALLTLIAILIPGVLKLQKRFSAKRLPLPAPLHS